MQVEVGFMKN